jgi:hypothetical protein
MFFSWIFIKNHSKWTPETPKYNHWNFINSLGPFNEIMDERVPVNQFISATPDLHAMSQVSF